ncbi:unnamed protein product, partial [Rotaria sp. Silwood2]
ENVFNTVPHSPPSFRPHRNPHTREETQRLIDEFLEAGLIQESTSPYASPAFIVPRKDNRPGRLVVDYRAVNKITIPDASPLPHAEDLLHELGKGYKYFSRLDLKSGYHQFRLPPADRPKTAFVVSQGHYEFRVLSMGPQNAPAAFQKIMYKVMKPCRAFCHVFLDDIIICSNSFDEHINHLKLAFETLATEKLVLNASKCELAVQRVVVLGHTVSDTSIAPTTDAIQAILDLKEPRTLKETNKFLGGMAYYRKFVPNFSTIAAPLHKISNLTKDRRHLFKWTVEQSNAFHALKRLLTTAPLLLHFPVDGFPLHLATDASGTATGGVLFQDVNGQRHNLFYHSKVLSPIEQKYSVPEKEALAIYHCLQRMRTLILGRTVYIHTDHCPICGMLQKPVNNRRIERVANLIQEYRIAEMKHIDGKSNCLADYLSRPSDDPLFDVDYGLDSKLPWSNSSNLTNPCQPSQNIITTMTLRPRQKFLSPGVSIFNQDDEDFDAASCTSENSFTTHSPIITSTPSPNVFDSSQLSHEQAQDPDIRRIISQLNRSSHPDSTLSSSFIIKNGILNKLITLTPSSRRRLSVPYLPSSMIRSFLTAMHDDPFQGGHFSFDKMMSKIRTRYWWPHMKHDVHRHVQACVPCNQYNYSRQKKPGHLQPIPPIAIPFSIIGMDFCGPFLESPRDNKYVLV